MTASSLPEKVGKVNENAMKAEDLVLDRPSHWGSAISTAHKGLVNKTPSFVSANLSKKARLMVPHSFSRLGSQNLSSSNSEAKSVKGPISCQPKWIVNKLNAPSSTAISTPSVEIDEVDISEQTDYEHRENMSMDQSNSKSRFSEHPNSKTPMAAATLNSLQHSPNKGVRTSKNKKNDVGSLTWLYFKAIRDSESLETWTTSANSKFGSGDTLSESFKGLHDPRNKYPSITAQIIEMFPSSVPFKLVKILLFGQVESNHDNNLTGSIFHGVALFKDSSHHPLSVHLNSTIKIFDPIQLNANSLETSKYLKRYISQLSPDIRVLLICNSWELA